MRRLQFIATVILMLVSLPAIAQDTCRIFTISNPHGAAMTISSVFIADTVNFSVEPLRTTPFNIGATETWDARVCIKARDGQSHSTMIRYQTTHGQASYAVTMTAPGPAGIDQLTTKGSAAAFPQPTSGRVTIRLDDRRVGQIRVRVYDNAGILLTTSEVAVGSDGNVTLDLAAIPGGSYIVVLDADGHIVARSSVVVAH
jgi:hypothetical protein